MLCLRSLILTTASFALLLLSAAGSAEAQFSSDCLGKSCGVSCRLDGEAREGFEYACDYRARCLAYNEEPLPPHFCPNVCSGKSCGAGCCPYPPCFDGSHQCNAEGECVARPKGSLGVSCPLEDPCAGRACGDPCCRNASETPCIADGRCSRGGTCDFGFPLCGRPDESCIGKACGQVCCSADDCGTSRRCNSSGQCVAGKPECYISVFDGLPDKLCTKVLCDECARKSCGARCQRQCDTSDPEDTCNGWCTDAGICSREESPCS